MTDLDARGSYGYAMLEPDGAVIAGSYGTWRLTYVAGSEGVASGGRIRVYTDSDTDWGIPQFRDPAGEDYMTVLAPEGVRVAVLTQGSPSLLLHVRGRALEPGERVALTYGDRSRGGLGSRAQTFVERKRYFSVAVDSHGDGSFVSLPDPPHVSVVGGLATDLVAIAPSTVVVGQPFSLLVKAQDAWGNPAQAYRGRVRVESPIVETGLVDHAFSADDGGVWRIEGCRCSSPGLHRIGVEEEQGELTTESNPILCVEAAGPYTLFWGDPHGGQLHMAAKIPDFFRYARDIAAIDFTGYQANGHRVSTEDWAVQQRAEREFYQPGRFVPLPGFEWTGETRAGGHHNVYFRRHGQAIRRSGHLANIAGQTDHDTDLPHILDVHQAYRNTDTVITPHVGGGRADLTYHEPNLEPVIEVTSTHGTFEWFLEDALRRGYKLGFIGGSDGYTGRPGAEYPGHLVRRYAKGGLAALYASELTIDGILEALQARRGYGTTGARILIRLEADGHVMGDSCRTRSLPRISAFVAGSAPLESVELFRGLERVYSHPLEVTPARNRVRILWEGASRRTSYSGVIWDGRLQVAGGRIALGETIRFDSPRSHVFDLGGDGLRWHSVTCGYRSGMVLEVEGSPQVELDFAIDTSLITRSCFGGFGDVPPSTVSYTPAERLHFRVRMGDVERGPVVVEVGSLNRRLTISLAPEAGTREVEFTYTDPAPLPGINPYWLRVVQADMEMAWTSPVFLDCVAAPD